MSTPNAIAKISADASILISEISKKEKGELITWEWIAEQVGWDVRAKRNIMQTVKNRLTRDYSLVLGRVHGRGYRILTDEEVANGELSRDRNIRRRAANRSLLKAGAVNASQLSEQTQVKYYAEVTAANLEIAAAKDKSVKRLESTLNGSTTPLALNRALEAIKNESRHPNTAHDGTQQD